MSRLQSGQSLYKLNISVIILFKRDQILWLFSPLALYIQTVTLGRRFTCLRIFMDGIKFMFQEAHHLFLQLTKTDKGHESDFKVPLNSNLEHYYAMVSWFYWYQQKKKVGSLNLTDIHHLVNDNMLEHTGFPKPKLKDMCCSFSVIFWQVIK